jgi:hypothetical protein
MISLVADSDSRGNFVSIRYHKDSPPQSYPLKFTLAWLDDNGCELTNQYGNDGDFEVDYNKKIIIIGVDEV